MAELSTCERNPKAGLLTICPLQKRLPHSALWCGYSSERLLVRHTSSPLSSMLKIYSQGFFYLCHIYPREMLNLCVLMKTLIKCSAIPTMFALPFCAWSGGTPRILLAHSSQHACYLACFTTLLSHNKLKWKKMGDRQRRRWLLEHNWCKAWEGHLGYTFEPVGNCSGSIIGSLFSYSRRENPGS